MAATSAPTKSTSQSVPLRAPRKKRVASDVTAERVALESPRLETAPRLLTWTCERYDRAIEAGVLTSDDAVELLDGVIVAKMPQNRLHEVSTGLVSDVLRAAFGPDAHPRDEKSVALSEVSKPEPDVVVVRGERREFVQRSPTPADVLLLVEVSDSTLADDRGRKATLCAEADIVEYWIVNLRERVLEVYRDPAGGAYRSKTTYDPSASVSPLNAPNVSILVSDLLP